MSLRELSKWLLLALAVIALDQASKIWMESLLMDNVITLTSWFELRLAYNTGAAFSFLANAGGWQQVFFIGLSIIVSVIILIATYRMHPTDKLSATALQFILGGAIGNVIDRIRLGHVIDFFHLHYHQYSWPIFNLADSALCLGVGLWIVASFRHQDQQL